jgi:hypothetical protein
MNADEHSALGASIQHSAISIQQDDYAAGSRRMRVGARGKEFDGL